MKAWSWFLGTKSLYIEHRRVGRCPLGRTANFGELKHYCICELSAMKKGHRRKARVLLRKSVSDCFGQRHFAVSAASISLIPLNSCFKTPWFPCHSHLILMLMRMCCNNLLCLLRMLHFIFTIAGIMTGIITITITILSCLLHLYHVSSISPLQTSGLDDWVDMMVWMLSMIIVGDSEVF